MIRIFFGLVLISSFNVFPALAEDSTDEAQTAEPPPAVLEIEYKDIESLGLYTKAQEGSLGQNFWQGTSRTAVTALLKSMPASTKSPAIQNLIFSALLTAGDSSAITGEAPPEPGEDLLTLRLKKLLEGGAYTQAFELYSLREQEPYHENLARAGVLSMLLSGEKSTACLETNTVQARFTKSPFWTDLAAYCDATLSEKASKETKEVLKNSARGVLYKLATKKKFRFEYQPEGFGALSMLERAVLAAEQRLDISSIKEISANAIPPADLPILLGHESLSEDLRLSLTLEAARWGLRTGNDIKELYTAAFEPASGTEQTEKNTATKNNLRKLPYYFHKVSQAEKDEEQWETIRKALPLTDIFGPGAFLPFAETLARTTPQNASLKELHNALIIMHKAGSSIPDSWLQAIEKSEAKEGDYDTRARIMSAAYILKPQHKRKKEDRERVKAAISLAENDTQQLLNNIIENVDKHKQSGHNAAKAYEKHYLLTFGRDYVMPSDVVWDRLITASQEKAIAETILLNIVLFSDQALQNTYPGLLRDALQSIEYVDLKNISQDMAVEASLGGF